MVFRFLPLLAAAFIGLVAPPASAQSAGTKLIGTFGDWSAYQFSNGDKNGCYIVSTPKKAVGNYKKRDEVSVLVTHWPSEKTRNVFQVIAGYNYKAGSSADVAIDDKKFVLFTQNDTAWATDAATDNRLADALRKGKSMVIKGTSSKGTETTDTYGLKGSGAAFDAINKACP